MTYTQPLPQPPRYLTGIGISLAVHLLLIIMWQAARPEFVTDDAPLRVQFLRLLPAPVAERAVQPTPAESAEAAEPAATQPRARRPAGPAPAQPTTSGTAAAPAAATPSADESASAAITSPALPATTAPSAADLLQQAKAAAGGIDSTLRKENPRRGIQAPIVTATMKLERGIARAAEMAPNKWYQAPKVSEVQDPGGYGRRRHRVVTAAGTYCVTYESNRAPDGIDSMQHGIKPKKTNCDDDEEPATSQDWNHKGP